MVLNGLIFNRFYEAVTNYIYKHELISTQRKKISANGSGIWLLRQFDNPRGKFIYQLYLPEEFGKKYLTNKKSRLKSDSNHEEDVKDEVIIKCLTKIGYTIPKEIHNDDIIVHRIVAKVLIQLFMQDECPSYYQQNLKWYHVYDEESKKIIFQNLNRRNPKKLKAENSIAFLEDPVENVNRYENGDQNDGSIPNVATNANSSLNQLSKSSEDAAKINYTYRIGEPLPSDLEYLRNSAIEFVYSFYDVVSSGKLESANDYWLPGHMNLFSGNVWFYEKSEFRQIESIALNNDSERNINLLSVDFRVNELSSSCAVKYIVECIVAYEETFFAGTSEILDSIRSAKVGDIEKVIANLTHLIDLYHDSRTLDVSDLDLRELFNYMMPLKYLKRTFKNPVIRDGYKVISTKKTSYKRKVVHDVTLHITPDIKNWKIYSIDPINTGFYNDDRDDFDKSKYF